MNDLSDRAHTLGDFIREQRRIARLSLRKLSDMAQISNPYLSQIERGLRKPSAEILQQLAKALRISAETLYIQAGILEERPDASDLTRAIWDDHTLTEAQKRALVQVYRSFQAENHAVADLADLADHADHADHDGLPGEPAEAPEADAAGVAAGREQGPGQRR